jgi:hypothetical protein
MFKWIDLTDLGAVNGRIPVRVEQAGRSDQLPHNDLQSWRLLASGAPANLLSADRVPL